MKIFLLVLILVLSIFVVFGRGETKPTATPTPTKSRVHFTNRTEAALALQIDGVEMCTAESMGACEGVVAYGPHKLAAAFRGQELIHRNSPAKSFTNFVVCHEDDMTPICKPSVQ